MFTTKLADILPCNFEDVHLCHRAVENEPCTICELSDSTLTAEGKQAWTDVMNADVHRIYNGFYGLQIELSGVKPSRLDAFFSALAGYCSAQDYETWFAQEDSTPKQSMGME